jgi:hypothetical protein
LDNGRIFGWNKTVIVEFDYLFPSRADVNHQSSFELICFIGGRITSAMWYPVAGFCLCGDKPEASMELGSSASAKYQYFNKTIHH